MSDTNETIETAKKCGAWYGSTTDNMVFPTRKELQAFADAITADRDARIAKLEELADKYKWQVRDTCVRAEKAEAQLDALTKQELVGCVCVDSTEKDVLLPSQFWKMHPDSYIPLYTAAKPAEVPDISAMVDRFLGWKLPADFGPDCGISFKRESDFDHPVYGRHKYAPIGTNLLNAEQAREMFMYCLAAKENV